MRVIVWLTECSGQNDSGTLLFDQRTRIIVVTTKRSCHPIPQPSNCAKRTADNLSNERSNEQEDRWEGERKERGVTRREIPIAIIISRREPRSLTARRAAASCRSADRAKRVSNDHSFSFSPLSPSCSFFFFATAEFIALHFARARARTRHVARRVRR